MPNSERPITAPNDDILQRGDFVSRLTAGLITSDGKISTGVVIGITGPWGAGKSSILNLLQENVEKTYPHAIIVRFDPWLISGHQDLVTHFISELLKKIREKQGNTGKAKQAIDALLEYGESISPLGNLVTPGIGTALKGLLSRTRKALAEGSSLPELRTRLKKAVSELNVPILVFVDELDRIEDQEIRAMTQLVKAVMDFQSISYVLAYDEKRVAQALGGNGDKSIERGRSYLEKIVQLQIGIPYVFPKEIFSLIRSELAHVANAGAIPREWHLRPDLNEHLAMLVPNVISTPRDVKRLLGTFRILADMVKGEVEWLDLFCFCALTIKAPATVEKIRNAYDWVIEDTDDQQVLINRLKNEKSETNQEVRSFIPNESERVDGVAHVLETLFPSLGKGPSADRSKPADSICFRRPLLTVLRLGIIPGAYSRMQVRRIVSLNDEDMRTALSGIEAEGELSSFLDRLEETFSDFKDIDAYLVWRNLARLAEKEEGWDTIYSKKRDFADHLAGAIKRLVIRSDRMREIAKGLLRLLFDDRSYSVGCDLLYPHYFQHGLYGREHRGGSDGFLSATETIAFSETVALEMKSQLFAGHLLSRISNILPLSIIEATDNWTSDCSATIERDLLHPRAFCNFVLMLFGGHHTTSRETIQKFYDPDTFYTRVNQMIDSGSLESAEESLAAALLKAGRKF